ncbi:hypothetical protein BDZ45DRAFT_738800 [Acephala macrosclerotiorum]|nr:hypothetical protein BDZ45DRAFT_738800 [Acephala macrosclerotiorum]
MPRDDNCDVARPEDQAVRYRYGIVHDGRHNVTTTTTTDSAAHPNGLDCSARKEQQAGIHSSTHFTGRRLCWPTLWLCITLERMIARKDCMNLANVHQFIPGRECAKGTVGNPYGASSRAGALHQLWPLRFETTGQCGSVSENTKCRSATQVKAISRRQPAKRNQKHGGKLFR